MKKVGAIVLTAALVVCLTACGGVSKSVDLKYGETYKIEDEKLAGKENLTWESEDSSIVSVSDDGTVTANAPGKAKVTIKEGEKSVGTYTFDITIVPIEQIIFSSDTIEVTNGDTTVLKYTLLPQDASDYGITWTCTDESVLKIRDVDEVKLIGQSEGKATIIATTENGITAQCAVEVTPKSAYDQLNNSEKQFVTDILPIMSGFKNPSSVRFNTVKKMLTGPYIFEVSAQNGFGGNTVTTYFYDKSDGTFMEWPTGMIGNAMNADLITQAVHEKLGY